MAIFKTLIRVGVITAACAGGAVLIGGPERTAALVEQAHQKLLSHIDAEIDDPVALRNQLRDLEREYPERIAQVRGDLAELTEELRQLERDKAVAERVVSLADRDLAALTPLLDQARTAQAETASYGGPVHRVVTVDFGHHTYTLAQAQSRAAQINQTKVAYANRSADAAHDLVYLRQQADKMTELLQQLEAERAQFQGQLWQLDRQVDAIARNEKLIDMLEKRRRTIEECSRYEVASLDQMMGRLAEVRARQQAELDVLTQGEEQLVYEDVARMQLDTESGLVDLGAPTGEFQDLRHRSPKLR